MRKLSWNSSAIFRPWARQHTYAAYDARFGCHRPYVFCRTAKMDVKMDGCCVGEMRSFLVIHVDRAVCSCQNSQPTLELRDHHSHRCFGSWRSARNLKSWNRRFRLPHEKETHWDVRRTSVDFRPSSEWLKVDQTTFRYQMACAHSFKIYILPLTGQQMLMTSSCTHSFCPIKRLEGERRRPPFFFPVWKLFRRVKTFCLCSFLQVNL